MNRRGFLQAILAAGVAPYVVTAAGVLMPGKAIALPEWGISIVGTPEFLASQARRNAIVSEILAHALPMEAFSKHMPPQSASGSELIFRRYVPYA